MSEGSRGCHVLESSEDSSCFWSLCVLVFSLSRVDFIVYSVWRVTFVIGRMCLVACLSAWFEWFITTITPLLIGAVRGWPLLDTYSHYGDLPCSLIGATRMFLLEVWVPYVIFHSYQWLWLFPLWIFCSVISICLCLICFSLIFW